MPLSIPFDSVILQPSFEFSPVCKNNCSLAFHLISFIWAKVLISWSFQISNTVSLIISKKTNVKWVIRQSNRSFTLHFAVFELSNINSTIAKVLLTFAMSWSILKVSNDGIVPFFEGSISMLFGLFEASTVIITSGFNKDCVLTLSLSLLE